MQETIPAYQLFSPSSFDGKKVEDLKRDLDVLENARVIARKTDLPTYRMYDRAVEILENVIDVMVERKITAYAAYRLVISDFC
jgi:hypothetical protein